MKGVRNFRVTLMNKESYNVTSEEAMMIMQAWNSGQKSVIIDGRGIACHQIIDIQPDPEMELDDVATILGMEKYDRKRIAEFMEKNKPQLRLGGG